MESLANPAAMPKLPTDQPAKPGKYYKKPKILTKRLPAATTVTLGTNVIIGALVYQGMTSDQQSRPEQSHRPSGSLLSQ